MTRKILYIVLLISLLVTACSDKKSETITQTEAESNEAQVQRQDAPEESDARNQMEVVSSLPASPAPTMAAFAAPQQAQAGAVAQEAVAMPQPTPADMTFENYGENPFFDTEDDHLSTFAMDVDTASYTLARSYLIDQGMLPPQEAIRPEEFINYFDTDYPNPDEAAFGISLEAAPAPFGFEGHYLLRVGIQGKTIAPEDRDPALLIFVVDVSGSMDMENRLGLVKQTLEILVGELREDDRIGIVVYSDNSRVVLNPTPASEADLILTAIDSLHPEGSTNVDAGLRLGYDLAAQHMREGDITRVIVLSDGVANVDVTSPDGILKNIKEGVEKGVTLTTVGFGMGNYNDVLMEQLANDGNGNYFYVDNLRQARRVFVYNLTGTLQVIGYDAKVQVDFNPEITDRYRLIGYENRAVADQDFRNDEVDAGEVGAGHSITALYEVALENADAQGVIATVYIRYQDADTKEVVELNQSITVEDLRPSVDETSESFRLHAAAAEFAELLRGGTWSENGNYADLLDFAKPLDGAYPENDQVAEFLDMIRLAGRYVDAGG